MSASPRGNEPPASPRRRDPWTLGITGGIGTGKTTLSRRLSERQQVPLLAADQLGHEALQPGSQVYEAVLARFGEDLRSPEGPLRRDLLAERAFADPAALEDLNRIVHPWILDRIFARQAALKASGYAYILLLDAALLLDWLDRYRPNAIVVVTAPLEARLARLEKRGLGREEALRRIHLQRPEEEWLGRADWVVDNRGSLRELDQRAEELWTQVHERWAQSAAQED